MRDIDRALTFYTGLVGELEADDESFCVLVVEGDPPSKARPRFTHKGQIYSSKRQREQEALLRERFRDAFAEPRVGNVAVGCIFYRRTRQRVDCDNMLKHVLDAANTICFADDVQVTALAGIVEHDPERPRTVIFIGGHESSMARGVPDIEAVCETCGGTFSYPYARPQPKRYCSRACSSRSRGKNLSEPVRCAHCGLPFRRRNAYQTLCSSDCRVAAIRGRHRASAALNVCIDCGESKPNGRAKRCRPCWRRSLSEDEVVA